MSRTGRRWTMRRVRALIRHSGPTSLLFRRRLALMGGAILVGLAALVFAWAADESSEAFEQLTHRLPLLPLLIVLAAVDPAKLGLAADGADAALIRLVAIIALVGWTTVARLVRSTTFSLRRRDFVLAAIVRGDRPPRCCSRKSFRTQWPRFWSP